MSSAPVKPTPFESLSIFSVIFSSLSAFFGAYVVLFILAVWGTYRHEGAAHRRLRWITVSLFLVILIHYVARAIGLGRSRLANPPSNEIGMWNVPTDFVTDFTATLAGTLSDGLLAWRFYVVYGRARWAMYLPAVAITVNTMLGLSGNFLNFSFYHNALEYTGHLQAITYQIYSVWGWCMLATNTFLTGAMIWRITRVSRTVLSTGPANPACQRYSVVIEAMCESAVVTWFGLVLFGVTSFVVHGRITTHWDVGYDTGCLLPMFFGISQCLITARLGFAMGSDGQTHPDAGSAGPSKGIAIMVKRETETQVTFDPRGSETTSEGKVTLDLCSSKGEPDISDSGVSKV